MASTNDGSEDVNDFLQRIKELGDRRDQEDQERNRKLEEEILQGRKERQARRAERARSISPTKSSPSNTPLTSRVLDSRAITVSKPSIEPEGSPVPREGAIEDTMARLTGSPTKENSFPRDGRVSLDLDNKNTASTKSSPSNAVPTRTSTLSWQQRRPNSQSSDRSRTNRPLSMVASENAARSPKATPESSTPAEEIMSRDQIAQTLASKDPSWFRQTADRGLNSPAYRRNQVEDEERSDHGSSHTRVQMPGMSREGSEKNLTKEETPDRSSSPIRNYETHGNGSKSPGKFVGGLGSPLPLTPAQRLDPPGEAKSDPRTFAMSPSQGRISPDRLDRPPSPTKGMGGFVQSAMMKRSDSVNKRWSVQSPPGLSRGNSVASNRGSHETGSGAALGNVLSAAVRDTRPGSLSRDSSHEPSSRPSSSHSNTTITQERPGTSSSMRSNLTNTAANEVFVKPSLPASRSSEDKSNQEEPLTPDGVLPVSPSKTMDSRRWSPTKSSWLESALNKPDSPKPKPTQPPQQPAWMSEINKAKQKSVDLGQSPVLTPKHEVKVGGLMRSPPPGGVKKPMTIGGLPGGFSSGVISNTRPGNRNSQETGEAGQLDTREKLTQASSSVPTKSLPVKGKTKPETPPKKDFRASLKAREPPANTGEGEEPEFKNVFGQLRRTKTQNYVAPDELKNNITRGKAALNTTGGPKKTERKDEFKEAILKKKDGFIKAQSEGKGVTRSASGGTQDAPLPEALVRRQALGRSGSIPDSNTGEGSLHSQRSDNKDFRAPRLSKETSAPARLQEKEALGGKLAGRFNPALASLLARGPPSAASDTSRSSSPALSHRNVSMGTSTTNAESSDAGPQLTHMTKGRARGPRRKAPSSAPALATHIDAAISNESKETAVKFGKPTPGTHPTGQVESSSNAPATQGLDMNTENTIQPLSSRKFDVGKRSQFLQEIPNNNNKAAPQTNSERVSPTKAPSELQSSLDVQSPKVKPVTPVKSPSLKMKQSQRPNETEVTPEIAKPTAPFKSPSLVSRQDPKAVEAEGFSESSRMMPAPLSPIKVTSPSKHGRSDSTVSVKNAAALWSSKSAEEPTRAKSPIKLPTRADEKAGLVGAGLRPASPEKPGFVVGLGIQSVKDSVRPLPVPPIKGAKPSHTSSGLPTVASQAPRSPVSQSSDTSQVLATFFGINRSYPAFTVDTAEVLSSRRNQNLKVKTLQSALYQISSDGKKQLVPAHQERVLFEGNLYLCTHIFENESGKQITQVNYWIGDDVEDTEASGAKIFAQKEARSANAELCVIYQGKETPELFSALGGIIIIRRGTANKFDSLAPHILCGRKQYGQIAFDEVDYSPSSLCSGFPYLISTKSGKYYLWKGKGSCTDELSAARLIGMDLGMTGEVEEVEEGGDSSSFLHIFGPAAQIPKSADHWRLKPSYNKYSTRLFLAENNASGSREQVSFLSSISRRISGSPPPQIVEINHFSQSDLESGNIYVLDAFFEMYIIVGSESQSQYAAFYNALLFAQEYGILAAGMEDRPFVPPATVVLEGVPKDLKSVFRKWKDELAPTVQHQSVGAKLQRGRSLRVVGLNAALEAVKT